MNSQAKLYEQMQGRGLDDDGAGEDCLVDFEQKAIDQLRAERRDRASAAPAPSIFDGVGLLRYMCDLDTVPSEV